MEPTELRAGDGVTVHQNGAHIPGTVVRVSSSGHCVWYHLDADYNGSPAPTPAQWFSRAFRHPDGVYRDDEQMWRVELGVRRPFRPRSNDSVEPDAGNLETLEMALERLEPYLLKKRWYPMSYMMIPSVLNKADELVAVARAFVPTSDEEQARAHRVIARTTELRVGFRREMPMDRNERMKLDADYRATTFVVTLGDAQVELRADRRHPELDELLAKEGATHWACITALAPRFWDLPEDSRKADLHHLEVEIATVGGRCLRGMSAPDNGTPGVDAVLALIDRDDARTVGRRRHQHTAVVGCVGEIAELLWL